MKLAELQKEAHAIAKEKGCWDEERTFGDLIALVHSELSEALEAYREWGLASSLEILRRTIPPPSHRDPDQKVVECWFIYNKDARKFDYWEFVEYAALCKPEGVASELADVVIRVADIAEHYEVDLSNLPPGSRHYWDARSPVSLHDEPSFGEWIFILHNLVDSIRWRILGLRASAQVVRAVQQMAAHYEVDLDAAIEAKLAYNRTRSHRHGGKAL